MLEPSEAGKQTVGAARPVHLGGALSGRDIEAVNKTVSGPPSSFIPIPASPLQMKTSNGSFASALEARRRVKEQQKRVFKSEFRNTHFSYTMGPDGMEQFVSTPRAFTAMRPLKAIRCLLDRFGRSAQGHQKRDRASIDLR